jgi:SAM-dependent methyltransferase
MTGNDGDELPGPTVHAGSAAPGEPSGSEPPPPSPETDLEIEEEGSTDQGWSSPEAAPPPEPAPRISSPSISVPVAPTLIEAPPSKPPISSPESTPPGSRRLAPPPKPRKPGTSDMPGPSDAPLAANTPYTQAMPSAPPLPNLASFGPEPGSAQRLYTPQPSIKSGPPRPTSTPPLTKSNPPPAYFAALEQRELGQAPLIEPGSLPSSPQMPPFAAEPPRAPHESMPEISVGEATADDLGSVPRLLLEVAGAAVDAPPSTPPSAERPSEPPAPPTHIVVPPDDVSPPSKPTPAPAIQVMRIIAVGTPRAEPPPEIHTAEDLSGDDIQEEASLEPQVVARRDEPEELSEDDVAPDSERDDAISIPPEEVELPEERAAAAAEAREGKEGKDAKPPPPPRRPAAAKGADGAQYEAASAKSKRQKRPWWEEMFGEDFVRSIFKLSDAQVTREVNFIEESLGVAPGGIVLDLGCGSGHHAVELASRGYGVVGYDLSLYQLALAAEVAQEKNQKLNFLQGDMREMAFEEMFDGIYCWNTTFGYFEEEKNLNVAQRVFRALKPGGMFLIDVVNRDFAAVQSPNSLWFEGDSCVCMDDMSVDFIASRLRVKRAIILDDGRTKECSYSVRLYSLHELGKLLHDVGFRVTEASGDPTMPGVFFGPNSPRIIMLAQKPEAV